MHADWLYALVIIEAPLYFLQTQSDRCTMTCIKFLECLFLLRLLLFPL